MADLNKTAVLLLAYGGPDSLDDIPEYLLDIRGGRLTPQHLIDEITERYRLIGGRSPLCEITWRLGVKLEEQINLPVYVGMRHWQPYIADVVLQMALDGVERIVALCMAPHYSDLSIGKYREKVDEAVALVRDKVDRELEVLFVKHWHTQPDFLSGLAENIRQTLDRWPPEEQGRVKVVFTAHSLPAIILERGDPYDGQLRETAALLAEMLALAPDRWQFCYQSAALTGVPWLGPQIEELVPQLAEQGERDVLIAPIGFIADHVEVLYDIDIGVRKIAEPLGVRIERPPMLNDSAPLVTSLAQLVHEVLEPVNDR